MNDPPISDGSPPAGTLIRTMTETPFVPADFVPPSGLASPHFLLEPLGPQHNDRDYSAWTSSS